MRRYPGLTPEAVDNLPEYLHDRLPRLDGIRREAAAVAELKRTMATRAREQAGRVAW